MLLSTSVTGQYAAVQVQGTPLHEWRSMAVLRSCAALQSVLQPACSAEEPPFCLQEIFDNILDRNLTWPADEDCEVSEECKDLVDRLLTLNPRERLGHR